MNTTLSTTNPTFVEHEGFYYLTFEGEYFKGCKRCGGQGHYSHNGEHSRCYGCDNTSAKLGEQFDSREAAEKWCHGKAMRRAAADRKREAERQAKLAARQAAWDALAEQHPAVWALMSKAADTASWTEGTDTIITERDPFVLKLADQMWSLNEKAYSPRQIAALQTIAERRTVQQAEAAAHPAPTGRVAVTGEIMSTKMVTGDYGVALKILVKDDAGYKVWVSLPNKLADEACSDFSELVGEDHSLVGYSVWFMGSTTEPDLYKGVKGRRLTFMANLEPSQDDPAFAFGSRPTKASWI